MIRRVHIISIIVLSAFVLGAMVPQRAAAEEIWLYDNTRVYGLVQRVAPGNKLGVFLPTGEERLIDIEDIVAIRFLGRDPLLVQSGTQEFRFINGGQLRGQILGYQGDRVNIDSPVAGTLDLDLTHVRGFVSLPMIGFSSLKADELVESKATPALVNRDTLVDRRGSQVAGVVRHLERTALHLDIDDLLQVRPFNIHYLRGVRLADATRAKRSPWDGELMLALTSRDRSMIIGRLDEILFRQWALKTDWLPDRKLSIALDEISMIQVMGGKVQYLSQLMPEKVQEQTILAPPQPYQMDRNCQGDSLSIAGKRYPWGIGVHADSDLTFSLSGRYQEFRSDIGIDTRMGDRGSVVFEVLADGKSLYTSPLVRGSDPEPRSISVPIKGVNRLTLRVTSGDDLDLGDVANWGSARVLKISTTP